MVSVLGKQPSGVRVPFSGKVTFERNLMEEGVSQAGILRLPLTL